MDAETQTSSCSEWTLAIHTLQRQHLDDYESNTAEIYIQKENYIRTVKSKVMEHLEGIEEARWMMEEAKKELDMERVGIHLDPEHEQNQNDCHQEGAKLHPDYLHLDTDGI